MQRYHLRRLEKEWKNTQEINDVLKQTGVVTIACSLRDKPYLFTVDFVWEPQSEELWFHCATEGRKWDILRANPHVCATIVEDRGYIQGECDHAYRSLIIEGKANIVTDLREKRRGLELLAQKYETNPEAVLARFARDDEAARKVGIVRIAVETVSGKQGPTTKS